MLTSSFSHRALEQIANAFLDGRSAKPVADDIASAGGTVQGRQVAELRIRRVCLRFVDEGVSRRGLFRVQLAMPLGGMKVEVFDRRCCRRGAGGALMNGLMREIRTNGLSFPRTNCPARSLRMSVAYPSS